MLHGVMVKLRVQEVRKLLLPVETVVDAILELDRTHGGSLAKGQMMEVRVETGDESGLTLVVMQGSGNTAAALQKHYTLPAVAAAVIHYCFRARIRLPRQATKSIEIVPEGFQLTISLVTEVPRLHAAAPQASQVDLNASPVLKPDAVEATGDAALDDPTAADGEPETAAA